MEFILSIDTSLFYFLNKTLANPFFDWFFPIITNQKNWNPIYIFLILFLIVKYKKRGALIAIIAILAVGITDYFGSHFIKEIIGRIRPCSSLSDVHLLVPCGGGKSFPSLHASNNFALAYVLSKYFTKNAWIFYTVASLIAISRVIVGVHYPGDVIGGAIYGTFISFIILLMIKKISFIKSLNEREK